MYARFRYARAIAAVAAASALCVAAGVAPAGADSSVARLIYVSIAPNGGPWQLMSTAPTGGAATPLFSDPATTYYSPAAAPGGHKLAFGWLVAGQNSSHIGIYDLDGGGAPVLFDAASTAQDEHPTWNRAATQIAFTRFAGGRNQIWLMNPDGTGQHPVPNAFGTNAVFSPSGAQLLFEAPAGALMTVNIDGSGLAALPGGAGGQAPNWAPDGHTIVFSRAPSAGSPLLDLYRLAAGGGVPTKISTGLGFKSALTSFSPDSQTVYFSNVDLASDSGNIYSVPLMGGVATQVTSGTLNIEPAISAPVAPADVTPPGPVTPVGGISGPPGSTPPPGATPVAGSKPAAGTTPVAAGVVQTGPVVLPAGPVTAPLVPGTVPRSSARGITAQTTGGVVVLSWNPPADTDFAGVLVTRDGIRIYDGRASRLLDRVAVGSTHTYTVTAYDASGNRGATVSKQVRALRAPAVRIATPTSIASVATPFRVSWSAPGPGVQSYTVQYAYKRWTGRAWVQSGFQRWLTDTTQTSAVFGVRNLPRGVPPGSTLTFRAYATSTFGDPTSYSASVLAIVPLDETAARAGAGWTSVSDRRLWLGHARRSAVTGASMTLDVTGSGISIVGLRCPTCGQFRVYESGVLRAVVDTRSASTQWRSILYTLPARRGAVARNVTLVVVGTPGRKTVEIDGFAVVR
ncbi:MAG: hypothetical protein ABI912_01180 [Actinomycetota bacterium]